MGYAEILNRKKEQENPNSYAAILERKAKKDHSKMVLDLGAPTIPGTHANSTPQFATGPSTVDMAKEAVQATTRTVGTVGISAGNLPFQVTKKLGVKGVEVPFQDEIDTTGSPITRAIFGDTPIKSFKKYGEAGIEFVNDTTGLEIDKRFAPFYAVAGIALDLSGTGKGAKTIFKSLHNAKTFEEAAGVMRTAGFDDGIIKDYAPIFAKTTAKKETSEALEAALKLQESTIKVPGYRPKTGDGPLSSGKIPVKEYVPPAKVVIKSGDVPVRYVEGGGYVPIKDARYTKTGDIFVQGKRYEPAREIPVTDARTRTIKGVESEKPYEVSMTKEGGIYPKTGDIFVGGTKYEPAREIPITDDRYQTKGEIPVRESFEEAKPFADEPIVPPKIDKEVLRSPGITTNPERMKAALKTKENALKAEKDYQIQLEESNARITEAGIGQASSADILARKDAADALKTIRSIKDDLPSESQVLDESANLPIDPVRENVGRVVVDIQARYGADKVTKGQVEKFKKNEQTVFMEMFRYVEEFNHISQNGGEMVQSIPKWIPGPLRDVRLMEELSKIVSSGDVPTVHGGPHMELYLSMVDEVARRSGIKNNGPKPSIDPTGAILQAHRERTAPVGAPIVQEEKIPKGNFVKEDGTPNQRFFPPRAERKWVGGITAVKDVNRTGEDIFEVSSEVFGESYPVVKKEVFDKFDAAKGRMTDDRRRLAQALEKDILKGLGIQRKSPESAAVMRLGEGKAGANPMTYDQVVKAFDPEKAAKIAKAAEWFRTQYDTLIDEINATRSDDYKIPHRDDYFRHFNELSGNGALANAFEDPGLSNLSNESLLTVFRKSFTKKREGKTSTLDAVGGFIDYINQYAFEKNIAPEIGRMNAFIDDLKNINPKSVPEKGLDGYIGRMEAYTEELNGMMNPIDAGITGYVPGLSKPALEVTNWFNTQAKRNGVLFNTSSFIVQLGNLPQGIGEAKQFAFHGMRRSMTDIVGKTEPVWKKSSFIKERYSGDIFDAFKVGVIEKTLKNGGKMISILDEISTKYIWNSIYEKALARGMDDPIKYADDVTRRLVGGRGLGEVSILQKSKAFQIMAPFTLEQFKMYYWLKKSAGVGGKFDPMGLMAFATTAFVLNGAFRWATGRDATFNPFGVLQDSYDIATSEEETKNKVKHVAGRVAGGGLSAIPLGNYVATAGTLALQMTEEERQEFFTKQGDPIKYGATPLLWNTFLRPLGDVANAPFDENDDAFKSAVDAFLGVGLPAGGKQIKNAIQGGGHLREENPDPMIQPGVPGAVRNILFGKWSPNFKYEEDLAEEMRDVYHKTTELINAGQKDEAKAYLKESTNEKTISIYEKVRTEERTKEMNRLIKETEPLVRTVDALVKANKKDEAREIIKGLTPKELGFFEEVRKQQKTEGYARSKEAELDPESWIRESIDFAYAFGTNPKQAWDMIRAGQHIETTSGGGFGGVVIARRMPEEDETGGIFNLEGSSTVKKELYEKETGLKATDNGLSNYKLEHKLPLTLGGTNERSNLELVTNEVHDSSTAMETYLGEAVKRQKIDYVDAQELILRFKGYEGEPITEAEIRKIVGVDKFPSYKDANREEGIHRGWDDIGRNSLWLSDQDYSERKADDGYAQGKRGLMQVVRGEGNFGKKSE